MSKSIDIPDNLSTSFVTSKVFERMTDTAELVKFLNATQRLSDKDFNRSVHDSGFRIMTLIQRAAAFKGDKRTVDACEVYLRRAEACLAQTAQVSTHQDAAPAPYSRPERETHD